MWPERYEGPRVTVAKNVHTSCHQLNPLVEARTVTVRDLAARAEVRLKLHFL